MSKAQIIRKKALDFVRDQDWPNAIKEYKRLVELDQSNPNLHNELADLYLKTSQKNEAYDAFIRAVDEYVRVGLHNNAVAVCKKLMRVLPARHEALAKLGSIRSRQGLAKEAESYYQQFLDKAAGNAFTPEVFQQVAKPIVDDIAESPPLLEKLANAMLAYMLKEDAGDVFLRLVVVYEKSSDSAGATRARSEVEKLGLAAKLAALNTTANPDGRTVITEDNLWTKTHSEGERIQVDTTSRTTPTGSPAAPAPQPAGAAPGGPSERDLYLLRLARGSAAERPKAAPVAEAAPPPAAVSPPEPAGGAIPLPAQDPAPGASVATMEPAPAAAPPAPSAPAEAAPPRSNPAPATSPASGANGSGFHVSALMGDDASAAGETDYRSHYDLGMAYIEMALFTEAIREYQLAAKSPQFQVKCLEMIGLCFIKQNQPQLAIRQLSKGLSLIGTDTEESLGIKYNLGLAYEMIGDLANARTFFEDVYVVDVSFRDVSDKVRKLAGSA